MRKNSGFSLIELTIVITVIMLLYTFALPQYMKAHKEAKVSLLSNLRGHLISVTSTLSTVINLPDRVTVDSNGKQYIQYDGNTRYLLQNKLIDPSEICHVLGILDGALLPNTEQDSKDGYYTCTHRNKKTASIEINKVKTLNCQLVYQLTDSLESTQTVKSNVNLAGDCEVF